jgi:putative RecB family exonuclease
MDIHEYRAQPHLSVSQINAYTECGLYYKFSKIDGIIPDYTSDALVFGSAIHHVIAQFQQERMTGTLLTTEELQHLFGTYWREQAEDRTDIRYKAGKNFQTLLNDGYALLAAYSAQFPADTTTVLAIEEPFVFFVEGLPVPIIGVIDLVEEDDAGTLIISDLKTSGRLYSSAEIDQNMQLTVYHKAARSNGYHDRDIMLRLDVLLKTKVPRFEQVYTVRSDDDEQRVMKKFQVVWDGITKNVFIPNDTSWKCAYCEYKEQCQAWHRTP